MRDWLLALACAALPLIAVLVVHPTAKCGFVDDPSYAFIARKFAETGRIVYDGWSAPMLWFQAVWGGALIRLFGFSFLRLRFSTLPFAAACGALVYILARKAGLQPRPSAYASACVTLSPVFIPLAGSFMTDVYGCFFTFLSLYCGILALERRDQFGHYAGWLTAAVIVGLVGGANRQIVWSAPLALLAVALWRRAERKVLVVAAGLLVVAVTAMIYLMAWHARQPFAVGEMPNFKGAAAMAAIIPRSHRQFGLLGGSAQAPKSLLGLVLEGLPNWVLFGLAAVLAGLPGFLCVLRARIQADWKRQLKWGAAALVPMVAGMVLGGQIVPPWAGSMMTAVGVLHPYVDMIGERPATLSHFARLLMGFLVLACVAQIAIVLRGWIRGIRACATRESTQHSAALWILGVFSAFYLGLLLIPAIEDFMCDRYVLPLLGPAVILALVAMGPEKRVPWYASAALVLFAAYGVASAHDYFAALRARVAAFHEIQAAGVPATAINGGFELDLWTQEEAVGRVNNPWVRNPKNAYVPLKREYPFLYSQYTPAIRPKYFLAWSKLAGLADSEFAPVEFRTWLRPYHRRVLILVARSSRPPHTREPGPRELL